jgi:hypothetical protein
MSALEDKLIDVRPSIGGKAQSTRKKLLERWGSREESAASIVIDTIGGREVWRRIGGDIFEQEVRS